MNFTASGGETPSATVLTSPSGTITDTTPTYTWNAVSDSTWYKLWVDDSTGTAIKKWYTAAQAGCESGAGTCSVTPSTTLDSGNGIWWVRTYNDNGNGEWSSGKDFTIPDTGSETCDTTDIVLTANGESKTLSLISFQGFEQAGTGSYTCAWNSWDTASASSSDQLAITGLSGNITTGTTFIMTGPTDNSDPSHMNLIWNDNMYLVQSFSLTFTKWEGAGGYASGYFSATFQGSTSTQIRFSNIDFCIPIFD